MSANGMEVREVNQMSDASRSRRRGLVLRFVLIALMVLAVNILIQLFIGASLGVVENACWLVSAALLGWAGSFGHDRLSGEWPGAGQDTPAAARALPSEPSESAPPPPESAEPVRGRPGPVDEASSQPTPIDPVRVNPTFTGPASTGPARAGSTPAAAPAPATPVPPAAAATGQTRPMGPAPAAPGDRRWRRTSGRWFRR